MTATFQLFAEDFIAYQMFQGTHAPTYTRRKMLVQWGAGGVLMLLGIWAMIRGRWEVAAVQGAIAVVLILFYPMYLKRAHRRHYTRFVLRNYQARFGQEVQVVFGEAIEVLDATSRSTLDWSKLSQGIETEEHLFLLLDIGGALILPKNRLESFDEIRKSLMDRGIGIRHEIAA